MNKRSCLLVRFFAVLLLAACAGCSPRGFSAPGEGDPVKIGMAPSAQIEERQINRSDFRQALSGGGSAGEFRLVEVYRRNQEFSAPVPEYRVFDVNVGSPIALLGVKNGDLLRGANGFAIYNVAGFREFVRLVGREDSVTLDIERGDQPVRLAVRFVD